MANKFKEIEYAIKLQYTDYEVSEGDKDNSKIEYIDAE